MFACHTFPSIHRLFNLNLQIYKWSHLLSSFLKTKLFCNWNDHKSVRYDIFSLLYTILSGEFICVIECLNFFYTLSTKIDYPNAVQNFDLNAELETIIAVLRIRYIIQMTYLELSKMVCREYLKDKISF